MGFGSYLKQSLQEQLGSWDNFTEGFKEGFFGTDYLRDYQHASKTFVADGQALAPTQKFLFHVYFTLNPEIPGLIQAVGGSEGTSRIGLLVKTAQLPSYTFDTETLNQYNRKRIVQTKVNYSPVMLTLHDDGSDVVRSMWFNYFNYYYKDASYGYDGQGSNNPSYNTRDIYNDLRNINGWGYDGSSRLGKDKPAFFKDIKIYGMNKGNFTSYTLINPTITDFKHDIFDYSQSNGTMEHTITLQYEAVKYGRGKVGGEIRGYGDPAYYDQTPSPLSSLTTASLFGRGGILDSGRSILTDLASGNILGAIRTGGSLRNTLKGVNASKLISSEIVSSVISTGLNFISNNGARSNSSFSIPTLGSNFGLNIFGGNISNNISGMFGGTSFSSLNNSLSNSNINLGLGNISNTFSNLSPSINSLTNQFAGSNSLNTDYTGLFKNLQTSVNNSLPILENGVTTLTSTSTANSTVPSITNLVNDIPGVNSLKDTLNTVSPEIESLATSFMPVVEGYAEKVRNNIDEGELRNIGNSVINKTVSVFSNGENITK